MRKYVVVFLLILSIQVVHGQVPSDKLEYGYNGNPKVVTSFYYNGLLEKEDGKWVLNEEFLYFKEQKLFDSLGNMLEKRYWNMSVDKENPYIVVKLHHTNNVKDSFTKFDGEGNLLGVGRIDWKDAYAYTMTAIDEKESAYSELYLTQNFRDSTRSTIVRNADSVVLTTAYVNVFDRTGELVESVFTDKYEEKPYSKLYVDKDKDEQGNWVKFAIILRDSGQLSRYVVQEFEYYE